MTATTDLTPDQQYKIVYDGIVAVAERCDGAVEDDGVGFSGQDTLFGRRIAAVPFSEWTPDVKIEAARIANKYQAQIERYLGVQVTDLPVVQGARELKTLHTARDDARRFERQAKNAHLMDERKAQVKDGKLHITWAKKDPGFSALLADVKRLPGRSFDWNTSANIVDLSVEAVDFIERHAFACPHDLEVVRAEAQAEAEIAAERPQVTLEGNRVRIAFDYDPILVAEVRSLPGRQYDGRTKTNTADLHVEVLAFADRNGLRVADDVREALAGQEAEISAEQAEADLRKLVSGLADPADLPEEFVARVLAATSKAKVV